MYLAFQQGIIEGGPEPIGISVDQRNVEVAKHWTRTDEYYQIINIMMNKARFNALTKERQGILREAAKEAGQVFQRESARGFTDKRERAEKEFGVTVHQPDLAPWQAKAPAIIEKLEADGTIPKGLSAKVAEISSQ
jgi:TRAP-type C4-dicarboxylate transport system substrate-binding protein